MNQHALKVAGRPPYFFMKVLPDCLCMVKAVADCLSAICRFVYILDRLILCTCTICTYNIPKTCFKYIYLLICHCSPMCNVSLLVTSAKRGGSVTKMGREDCAKYEWEFKSKFAA